MRLRHALNLYGRLLSSYLLVVLVASVTLYVVSETLAPAFLGSHLDQVQQMNAMMTGTVVNAEAELLAAHARAMQQAALWSVVASALVAGGLSLFVAGRIASPLRAMQRASSRIASGHYRERLSVQTQDEIGELAKAFNAMARQLAETEERRLELLANVAHEFRTPLSSLTGYLEGLEDGYFAPDEATLGACRRQVERLRRLTDDLALLSRVEAGQEPVKLATVEAGALLEQIAASFKPQFAAKRVALGVRAPEGLRVLADEARTLQILGNLVSNALRHTPAGGEVRLSASREGREVRFEVADSGEGIAAAAQPHVFTRFFKAAGQGQGGSGIGLTIARHFVEVQGGRIGLESQPGEGSRFWFTLLCA